MNIHIISPKFLLNGDKLDKLLKTFFSKTCPCIVVDLMSNYYLVMLEDITFLFSR